MRSLPKLLLSVALAAAACGGASDPPPAPLARHFDDMYIAAIPLDQKQAVVTTQNDWAVAKMQRAKAEADLGEAGTLLEVARNDAKNAHNDTDSAVKTKKAADQSGDQNRIGEAVKELQGVELGAKAADERVRYLTSYRQWLARGVRFAEEQMYWRESQYELAKAKVAKTGSIAPKGFAFEHYVAQEAARGKRVTGARAKADAAKARAVADRDRWLKLQAEADKARGRTTEVRDPMAPVAPPPPASPPAAPPSAAAPPPVADPAASAPR